MTSHTMSENRFPRGINCEKGVDYGRQLHVHICVHIEVSQIFFLSGVYVEACPDTKRPRIRDSLDLHISGGGVWEDHSNPVFTSFVQEP